QTVRNVLYGILLTAPTQGLLALVGYWAVGLGAPVLLGAITTVLALTPMGAAIVYVPASLWLVLQGRPAAGIILIAWGGLVVSTSDNLIRSSLLRGGAVRIPFLLGLFAIIGGVAAFGPIGLFIGPMVVTLLMGLVKALAAPETPPDA
ncbi:MAG TPA: AI-2E family transporter, partial [Thermodesulfobacteriota bacterium]